MLLTNREIGANMEQTSGLDGSIPGGLSQTQKMSLSQSGFRQTGSQLNLSGKFHYYFSIQLLLYNVVDFVMSILNMLYFRVRCDVIYNVRTNIDRVCYFGQKQVNN